MPAKRVREIDPRINGFLKLSRSLGACGHGLRDARSYAKRHGSFSAFVKTENYFVYFVTMQLHVYSRDLLYSNGHRRPYSETLRELRLRLRTWAPVTADNLEYADGYGKPHDVYEKHAKLINAARKRALELLPRA